MSKDVLEMSDEEIMQLKNPPEMDETEDTSAEQEQEQQEQEIPSNDENQPLEDNSQNTEELQQTTPYQENTSNSDNNSDTIQNSENKEAIDYEGFYKKVMAPFKANGKLYNLKNADEVISLMQKGVDYTRKTQDISRVKKQIAMLERANLMDENQISFFIDLMSGNQEAIRKLLKDKNIDAFSLPSEEEPINYVGGSHNISSEELFFEDTVKDIADQDGGRDFLKDYSNLYDKETRAQLYSNPNLLKGLFSNKQSGVYDKIVGEIDRLRVLGQIPENVPFIAAYNFVGNMLFGDGNQNSRKGYQQPLTRRPATTSTRLNNSNRAKSAGITRSSPSAVNNASLEEILNLDDDEFMKRFGKK